MIGLGLGLGYQIYDHIGRNFHRSDCIGQASARDLISYHIGYMFGLASAEDMIYLISKYIIYF